MKINYRRKKSWVIKTPVKKPNKVEVPDSIYNRNKEKRKMKKIILGQVEE